jgi:hypothetical protein
MQRLVTFGCSCTFGEALPDCIIKNWHDDITPSKFAWPQVLANLMSIECDNRARPGNSNFQILDTILSSKIEKTDTVVVMWSYFGRDMIIDDNGRKHRIHSVDDNALVHAWASVHGITDLMYRSWIYIHHAYLYLRSLDVDFYFAHVSRELEFLTMRPEWARDINLLDTDIGKYSAITPKALDNRHPGTKAHALTAGSIFLNIQQLVSSK